MPDVVKTTQTRGVVDARTAMYAMQNTGLVCGEDIEAGHACRIGAGFKVFKAKAGDARFDGIAPKSMKAGQPITLFGVGTRFHATEGTLAAEPGLYYLSTTPGLFSDTATGAGKPVARAVSRHDLEIIRVGGEV